MALFPVPESLPRRGNLFSRFIGRAVLASLRWKITGELPQTNKIVAIGAPHTSNWDFVIGMAAIFALGVRVIWLGKHTIFRRPFRSFFRWLGGIPVDRDTHAGIVEQAVGMFQTNERMILGLAPEGTRKKVERWKTGFYRIAVGAQVPILLVGLDYGTRSFHLGPLLRPSGNLENDLSAIRSFYRTVQARYPERFTLE